MNALLQTGSSGRVPVPPEKRFLINFTDPARIVTETLFPRIIITAKLLLNLEYRKEG